MAREESDREDLLRQATALAERAELALPGFGEPIFVGFRRDGSASCFFGADEVYQFNAAGELRRAYRGGLLVKANGGRLVQMKRERSEGQVALVSRELSESETREVLEELRERLSELASALETGAYTLVGEVPADSNQVERIRKWLHSMPRDVCIASLPNVG